MPESMITRIETTIEGLLSGMTVTGGFNYDWNPVNPPDLDSAPFPSARIEFMEENNIDEPEGEEIVGPTGAFAEAYYNAIKYKITIGGVIAGSPGNDTIRAELNKALDDLKMVFGIHYTLNDSGASAILYRNSKRIFDTQTPPVLKRLESLWLVRYYQSRKEPSVSGET